MKIYLQNIVKDLKQFSESLDKQTLLINKPWALIDSDLGIQKLIFKKNKELILSKDGQVTEGKWDYFPEAKSLLIDRGFDKILCNENYIDDSILVLKMDGKKDDFFILANENNIPDLDAYAYLRRLYYNKYGIQNTPLADNRNIQIKPNNQNTLGSGSSVTIDDSIAQDGEYITKDGSQKIYVQNNKILDTKYLKKYKLENGDYLVIEQKNSFQIEKGCAVSIKNKPILDGEYLIEKGYKKLYVIGNQITRISYVMKYDVVRSTQVLIEQNTESDYKKGDKVWMDGEIAKDGKYKINQFPNFIVQNGEIIKKSIRSEYKLMFLIFTIGLILIILVITEGYLRN
jgi:hypothetical protein